MGSAVTVRTVCLAVACLASLASLAVAGQGSSLMDISADGRLLACSNRDSGTVTIVDLAAHTMLHEIAVGKHPEGTCFLGDSHRVAVAIYDEDRIVLVDADAGEKTGEVEVFDEPYGVASTADGKRLYATLDYPGRLVAIDVATLKITSEHEVGAFTRGLALEPSGKRALVTEYYTGNVLAVDLASGKVVDRWEGISNDNLARQIVVHPTRPKAYLTHIRSRVTAVHGEGSIFPYVSVIDTRPDDGERKRRRRIPMDAFRGALVTANPWDCAISPDGKQLFVVFAGTDDMFACDVTDDDYREITYRQYLQLGRNPRAVRVSRDGQTVYVYNALDFNVVAYNTQSLRKVAEVKVTEYPHSQEMLRGKVLFYSALQPMASRRWISCSSCHPDGQADGRTWHNPEGLRNTQSLAGMAWTHPIHWSADRDEVQDFEHTIRGKLMQGRGLLLGQLNAELGEVNRGKSADLDALAIYSNSHDFTLSPHAKRGLSEAAQRGREVFFSAETKCATCHSGPLFCGTWSAGGKIVKYNVGTGDDPSEKMGPEYDTPTLLGLYRTAPYLHDGRAATLDELLTTHNAGDRHGKTSHLTAPQRGDLVEYLKALPYEDPVAAARAAGMKRIDP
jgi:DNA-binding beta-propeller fold protein YncE